ncbi:hypothetical protein JKP88DRAFT_250361 [Tribonema minus]|uniref:Uncharacterized protein n=1 Tax=Tribonema minus TaxID=303371 RepID=A0A835YGX4_9STRA|nr:hypothetical protein JKP88DRAFT_250361 [Tribonema minus]
MPCSCCHKSGHNIRTCPKANADKWADIIAEQAATSAGLQSAKEIIFAGVDMMAPGAGSAMSIIDKVWTAYSLSNGVVNSSNKNAKQRSMAQYILEIANNS